uniref:GLOBIN domain-containing protein n=1 Tax=Steinernema glaseri TaxID=37863 RepID=A0A1I7YWT2_9BILA
MQKSRALQRSGKALKLVRIEENNDRLKNESVSTLTACSIRNDAMGASLCKGAQKKAVGSWVNNDSENPFEHSFTKKERICLRETYQRLQDPKEIIGRIFLDIVNDVAPEVKKVFGVERVPRPNMLKMPKLGGHVARVNDIFDQTTSMLGYTENVLGAWQLIRKTGRAHTKQQFLLENLNQLEKNYFQVVIDYFQEQFLPYLTGEKEGQERKKVRFAQNYTTILIEDVWKRFFSILIAQMTDSFEQERTKVNQAQTRKALTPHLMPDGSKKKQKESQSQSEQEPEIKEKEPEQMYEDPF